MKSKYPGILLLTLLTYACNSGTPSEVKTEDLPPKQTIKETEAEASFERDVVINSVVNKIDSSQSYSLFIPGNSDSTAIVILFFDPKGDGSIPVKKYQAVAVKHGIVIAGSNNSKNGMNQEQTTVIARNLVNDISTRLKFNRQNIVTSGFSGGARVAAQTAVRENLAGLIGCGAGFPFEPDRKYSFASIGLVGNEDFNYLEMKRLHKKLEQLGMKHKLIVFDGEHEWPTVERMEIAILCCRDLVNNKTISNDKKVAELLINNSTYLPVSLEENEIDKREATQQSEIAQAFSKQDFGALKSKINFLSPTPNTLINEQSLSNKRLLNFISLMGFLYSEKALSVDLAVANQYLTIYEGADYDNPDYHYLRACYFAKSGKMKESLSEIKKSVDYGFSDYKKMMNEQSLRNLHGEPDFGKVVEKLSAIQ